MKPNERHKLNTLKFRLACFAFRKNRGEFYLDLASSMQAAPGVNIIKLLERYAVRYAEEPVGVLCSNWVENMHHTGSFHAAIRGSIPDEDIALIAASEENGDLLIGLKLLGKNIIALKKVQSESWKSLAGAAGMLIILHVYLGIMAFMVLSKMEQVMRSGADLSKLGLTADILFGTAHFIQNYWWAWFLFVTSIVASVIWALPNYTGRYRRFLDDHVFIFQIYRDFIGASFIMSAAALSSLVGSQLIQFHDALSEIRVRSNVPWLNWQIDMIQSNMKLKPNSKAEIFDTGVTTKRMYYRILDIADYQEMSVMLNKVGDIILEVAPQETSKRAFKIRFTVMTLSLVLMVGSWFGTAEITDAYKRQVQLRMMR